MAGAHEAKEELKEIVEFLKNQKFFGHRRQNSQRSFTDGPAGKQQDLDTRAVAGESNVPFFHVSGSEFVELFVGIGASRQGFI